MKKKHLVIVGGILGAVALLGLLAGLWPSIRTSRKSV